MVMRVVSGMWLALASLLVGLPLPLAAADADVATATVPGGAPRVIRVLSDNQYPPFVFPSPDGRPQGYEVDMWALFERHTGIRVELEPMPWRDVEARFAAGQGDVIDMIFRTPVRESRYAFSRPIAPVRMAVYVDRRIAGVRDIASLSGVPVGVEAGDGCEAELRRRGVRELRPYTGYREIIQAAVLGDLRVFCMDTTAADFYLYRYHALERYGQAFVLHIDQLHRAVRKGDAALLVEIERGMASITPGELTAVRERWLGQPSAMQGYLRPLYGLLAAALGVVVLMLLWIWSLRRAVRRHVLGIQGERDKLRGLFDASPDAMWIKAPDGTCLECNDRLLEYTGRRRSELIGAAPFDPIDPATSAETRDLELDVMHTGQPRTQQRTATGRGGRARLLEVAKVPLFDAAGVPSGVLNVARDITARRASEERLRHWGVAFEQAGFGIVISELASGRITAVNAAFAADRGYAPAEMLGMHLRELFPERERAGHESTRELAVRHGHALFESVHLTRDGRELPVLLDRSVSTGTGLGVGQMVTYAQNISARVEAETELRLAAAAFDTQEALMVLDAGMKVQRVNPALVRFTGYAVRELIGACPSMLRPETTREAWLAALERAGREGYWQGEQWVRVKNGEIRVARVAISVVRDEAGRIVHYVFSLTDLSAEREARSRLERREYFDQLTDLPNRAFLEASVQQLLDAGEVSGVLLIANLDRFKRVNDLRGHGAGDCLLAQVAERMRQHCDGQRTVIARFGNDGFAVLMPTAGEAPTRAAVGIARRLRQLFEAPFVLEGGAPLAISVSMGWVAVVPGEGSVETLLKAAELAMFEAKAAGRDTVRGFEPAMLAGLERREALKRELHEALVRGALELHPQIQVDAAGHPVGAEMLLRWARADGENVGPDAFIPLAEEDNLILAIGHWALVETCRLLADWAAHPGLSGLVLAVNVSARQFAQPDFVTGVRGVLERTGAAPGRLRLEITEAAVLGDPAAAADRLRQLRALGVRIALDDFGTGYSSLGHLTHLPLDQLKIDRSFVEHVPGGQASVTLVEAILAIGHGLGLEVVAEGVETAAQQAFLASRGCDAFQGYLHARAMAPEAFAAWVRERMRAA